MDRARVTVTFVVRQEDGEEIPEDDMADAFRDAMEDAITDGLVVYGRDDDNDEFETTWAVVGLAGPVSIAPDAM